MNDALFKLKYSENGVIIDYTVANIYLQVRFGAQLIAQGISELNTWEQLEAHFKPLYQQLTFKLKEYIDKETSQILQTTPGKYCH